MSVVELALVLGIGALLSGSWLRHQDDANYLEQVAALANVLSLALPSYRAHCASSVASIPLPLPPPSAPSWSATVFTSGVGRLELHGVDPRYARRLASRFHGRANGEVLHVPLSETDRLPSASHQRRFLRQYATGDGDGDVCALR